MNIDAVTLVERKSLDGVTTKLGVDFRDDLIDLYISVSGYGVTSSIGLTRETALTLAGLIYEKYPLDALGQV